jgi:lipopolysaccharide/colanic/teichoic acid biosynthesis glycosyltransferase
VLKRLVDIILAAILLLLALPVLAVAATAVKLDSPGPVFFRQTRVGRRFRRFQLYKLRTMHPGAEGPVYTVGEDDSRITRAGRRLRHYKLDELPQLWNVLRGDMSLVGPRPVVPKIAMQFYSAYDRLLAVRPGLTDPASLMYRNEAEILRRAADPQLYFDRIATPHKIHISQVYLERATLWSDLGLIAKTAVAILASPLHARTHPGPVARSVEQRVPAFPQAIPQSLAQPAPGSPKTDPFEIPVVLLQNGSRSAPVGGESSLPV